MKQIAFTLLLLLFLALYLPIQAPAQIQVIKKPTLIIDAGNSDWMLKLEKDVVETDTSYLFEFRNASYSQLTDFKIIRFASPQLKEFGEALSKVLTASLKDQIVTPLVTISKEKGPFGVTYYELYYDHALCNMKEKQVKKLMEAINKE